MSFMRGDLFTKTRKLVKGLAKSKPIWLKAMEEYVISNLLQSYADFLFYVHLFDL